MLSLFFTLILVTSGVCLINFSSLNLTDNELKLLYAGEDNADEENSKLSEDKNSGVEDFGFNQESFSQDFEEDLEKGLLDELTSAMESEGVDLDSKRSKDEALRLTKEIYGR